MKTTITQFKINEILCIRYIYGYSEYDHQYKNLITELVKKLSTKNNLASSFDDIPTLVGEFNGITKRIYEDIIIQLFKLKFKKYPLMDQVYTYINNLTT